jgi:calcineurin-like phosphoesterase family protein
MSRVYISDTHFGHTNIIKYCNRPFQDVGHMDTVIFENLLKAESDGYHIYHCGDVSFNLKGFIKARGWLQHPERHLLMLGNHDPYPKQQNTYHQAFGIVVGDPKEYRTRRLWTKDEVDGREYKLVLSHAPLPLTEMGNADYNIFGHVHNNLLYPDPTYAIRNPDRIGDDYMWTLESPRHINVSVEVLGYKPKTLKELIS